MHADAAGSTAPSTAAFIVWFCPITRSRKPDNLSGFAISFLCGIKYLARKKPDRLSGFSLSIRLGPSQAISLRGAGTVRVSFFLSKTQKPNINVRFFEMFC
jgi:hypothetical protein